MRVMVLGAGGMLGHDLVASAPRAVELIALTHQQLDITDHKALEETVTDSNPEVVMNAAAYTAVDKAESDRDGAFRVNSEAVECIGRTAARIGAKVVHFSTDYVFDGMATEPYREDMAPNPLNAYGASKLAGEARLAGSGAPYLIIRAQWLFGQGGPSFPRTMVERAQRGLATRVVADQVGRPTYTKDLAWATWALALSPALGLVHVANEGTASWFDLARHVFTSLGVPQLVTPCTTDEYPTAAKRPAQSVLDISRFKNLLSLSLPTWYDAAERFLGAIRNEGR